MSPSFFPGGPQERSERQGPCPEAVAAELGRIERYDPEVGADLDEHVALEQVRVPLLLAGPGLPKQRVAQPVSIVRVASTVLRLVGVSASAP